MTEQELIALIEKHKRKEFENLEFKEWKNTIPFTNGGKADDDKKRCVYGYCVGMGNEGGGKLLIGVTNNGTIVGTNASFASDAKSWIFNQTGQKIDIDEVVTVDKKKVIIVSIPGRKRGEYLTFHKIPLMRLDDQLIEMDQITQRKILLETEPDWSGEPCIGTNLEDIDGEALDFLRMKKSEISQDNSYKSMSTRTFLNQLSLLTEDGVPNNACILFLGKKEIAERKLPAISRVIWLYIDEKNGFEDRINTDEQRSPLLLTITRIIEKIKKYNFPLEDFTLFRPDPVYQYDEKAVEELIANSLAHRDWTIAIPNDIRQTPHSLSFSNPGLFENDLEKVIEYSQVTPYRNQTLADFLSKINLMENERRGLQKVIQAQLSKGIFVIKEEIDNHAGGIVKITLDGKIRDKEFARLVLSEKSISRIELFLLQKIASGAATLGRDISPEQAEGLHMKGWVEYYSRSPNRKVRISYELLQSIQQTEKYVLSKGMGTKKKEKLILEYIEKKGSISTQEIYKLFPEANKNSLRVLLMTMKQRFLIQNKGKGCYILVPL